MPLPFCALLYNIPQCKYLVNASPSLTETCLFIPELLIHGLCKTLHNDFLINKDGAAPLPSNVEAISAFPHPHIAWALREFLGMVTFYHWFIRKATRIMRPLYEALKDKSRGQAVDWTAEREKTALGRVTMLAHPSHKAPIAITTDASDAVGAVHKQWVDGAWQPLAFFSHQLTPRERKYSTFDRQLLGLWLAIRHFRSLLEGRECAAFVDHKSLTFCMSKVAEPWSTCQQRQLSYISEYTTDNRHTAGKSNVVADCLSRAVSGAVQLGLHYVCMSTDQASDRGVKTLKTSNTGLRLEEVAVGGSGVRLW